jgi:2-octaprenyl-6-methoxyphenol hydroxylase
VLQAQEMGQSALGYVLSYRLMSKVLGQAVDEACGIQAIYGAKVTSVTEGQEYASAQFERDGEPGERSAALLALADGGHSLEGVEGMRRSIREYGQSAMIAQVESEIPHGQVAYERFTAEGPVALLPDGERGFALVWTATPERAQALCQLSEQAFLQALGQHFGDRVGRFIKVAGRAAFPLKFSRTTPLTLPHLVVIGNAAQTLHPVAGQGFNLGLRDAWTLAQLVRTTPVAELGHALMLAQYCRLRQQDRRGGMGFTDFLATTFASDFPGLAAARGLGISALDLFSPAKRFLSRKMSFGAQG